MIGITIGDPNGIGPELLQAAHRQGLLAGTVVFGPAAVLQGLVGVPVQDSSPWFKAPTPGRATSEGGHVAYEALQAAVAAAIAGQVQGLCTLPINKLTIQRPGFAFPGHTEYLGEHFARAGQRPLMLFVHGGFRLACLTAHIPLAQVPSRVTQGAVQDALLRLAQALQTDFGATHPRIAVLGLNPHAGDGGLLGSEEQAHIAPAIQAVQAQGLAAEGPFPPDGFFTHRHHLRYDATLAMYHDQGLIPFKALTHGHGVNFTAGLGLARTSPDHGTAYDIAGTGSADPTSFFNSLALLRTVLAHRGQHVA